MFTLTHNNPVFLLEGRLVLKECNKFGQVKDLRESLCIACRVAWELGLFGVFVASKFDVALEEELTWAFKLVEDVSSVKGFIGGCSCITKEQNFKGCTCPSPCSLMEKPMARFKLEFIEE